MVGITAGIIMVFLLLGGVGYRFRNGILNNSPSMAANNAAAVYGESLLQVPAARKILDMVDPAKRCRAGITKLVINKTNTIAKLA